MSGLSFALAVALGSIVSADPTELVEQLGSVRYQVREAAEARLAGLGRAAIPALRAARQSRDAEIRTRATSILSRVENALVLEATRVDLDFQDVPIAEAIGAISHQAGSRLILPGEGTPALSSRRITLRPGVPLPFWKAIDSFCMAGGLHPTQGARGVPDSFDIPFLLEDGPGPNPGPTSDWGPFRVQLSGVHAQDDGKRAPSGHSIQARPVRAHAGPQVSLELLVAAEPRLAITQDGATMVTHATDEFGKNLATGNNASLQRTSGYFGLNPSPVIRLRVALDRTEAPGCRIRVIRGTIPVIAAARRPEPMVIPVAGSTGRTARNEEVELTLADYRPPQGKAPATVQLVVRQLAPLRTTDHGEGEPLGYRPDWHQRQVEILDAEGHPMSWFPSGMVYNGDETRMTMTLGWRGPAAAPATIRFHSMIRVSTQIPFEFREIPVQ